MNDASEIEYNDTSTVNTVIEAGTLLYRISPWSDSYSQNSFNPSHREIDDINSGRFDPIERDHTGYLYLALSLAGAVGEGILRSRRFAAGGLIRRRALEGLSMTVVETQGDLTVSDLTGPNLRALNLSGSISGCEPRDYPWSRKTAARILKKNASTHGLLYHCRNNPEEKALFLLQRNEISAETFRIVESELILKNEVTLNQITLELEKYRIYISGAPDVR